MVSVIGRSGEMSYVKVFSPSSLNNSLSTWQMPMHIQIPVLSGCLIHVHLDVCVCVCVHARIPHGHVWPQKVKGRKAVKACTGKLVRRGAARDRSQAPEAADFNKLQPGIIQVTNDLFPESQGQTELLFQGPHLVPSSIGTQSLSQYSL